jgi:hypothetical protein
MARLTLRQASERSGLSPSLLLRFIRSGRLAAYRQQGAGEEALRVSPRDLESAGLPRGEALAARPSSDLPVPAASAAQGVPLTLYRELLMKHEQLLVQYGMVRVGGARLYELKAEAESKAAELGRMRGALRSAERRHGQALSELQARLRRAELALQERETRIAALESKIRGLELVTRNAVTTESIERRFLEVLEKEREVEDLLLGAEPAPPRPDPAPKTRDH